MDAPRPNFYVEHAEQVVANGLIATAQVNVLMAFPGIQEDPKAFAKTTLSCLLKALWFAQLRSNLYLSGSTN